ncbi:formate dehydrogenase subunit gamma [Brackiella oedipodis]|uniref:formate dehydrogenase subunit gamma n=1 Tax=Brackiella oedipodis TaxID=124225 RepID=UPI0006845BFF|nr:formate dehydrogenase subunit gamma [Brackiella oedipodis]
MQRYNRFERITHWVVAGLFLLLAISGLGFFYPPFFWFTHIFGSPELARMLHPFFGVAMFIGFGIEFVHYFSHNFLEKEDVKWLLSIKDVISGKDVGDVGRYNGGQKMLFWTLGTCMTVLILTGLISWRAYFAAYFPIPVIRIALFLHSCAAIIMIASIFVHIYAALWIKGSIRAMVQGYVTQRWAKAHHPRWYREKMAQVAQKNPDFFETKQSQNEHKDS